jgi:hypothetical protein
MVIPNDNQWEYIGILLGVNHDPSGNQTLLAGNSRTTGMFTTRKSLNCWGILQLLVGGFNPSEKYESDWIIIPTGKNKIHVRNHQPEIIKIYQP